LFQIQWEVKFKSTNRAGKNTVLNKMCRSHGPHSQGIHDGTPKLFSLTVIQT
jgi:hypothetical protein